MPTDPVLRLAQLRIIKASADLDAQIAGVAGGGPALEVTRRLKQRAAESLAAMAFVDCEDAKLVRTLQNEVKKYDEWIGWLRDIIQEGRALDRRITDDEREELLDALIDSPEGQREAIELGLVDEVPRDD